MSRFEEYNLLLYGETIGWINEKPVIKDLTPEEYQVLLSLLAHWKTRLRWSAASRLGRLRDSRAVGSLIQALQDTHWLVRLNAAKALGRIGDPKGIEPLIEAMNDECPYVRRRVVTALGQLSANRSEHVTNVLISALSDSDADVRAQAVKGLGAIASSSAVAAIATAVRDPDANVSWCAVGTLQGIGVPAVKDLIRLLDCQDREVRYRAIKTLGNIGDERAIRPLETMLNDPDEKVRGRAKFALRQFRYRAAWVGYRVPWGRSSSQAGKLQQ